MDGLFGQKNNFDEPLDWNVSNVIIMDSMFFGCIKFNKPLYWDVSKVKTMDNIFKPLHF
jgi:hypothetical protein